jgi:hypothetical protein
MATLGKCLLFYLKYAAEMDRLYETNEPKFEGLPNEEQVLEKIKLVGDTACREGADLLEACAPGIEKHFRAISAIQRTRNKLENTWGLKFQVAPSKTKGRSFEIGVDIMERRATLVPWVWSLGGRWAEDEVIRVLGGKRIKAATLGWGSGSVGLTEIKIPIPEQLEEPVASDSLVAQVHEAFASFTAQEVKEIAALSARRQEA